MANPSTATGGINRSALAKATARAPQPASPVLLTRAVRAPAKPEDSDFVYFLKALGWMTLGAFGLIALYALGFLMHDSMATGNALAEAKKERGTLVCQAGHMSHGDGSLHDLVFAKAYFVCDDWKTLETIKEEEAKAANPPQMKATQVNGG